MYFGNHGNAGCHVGLNRGYVSACVCVCICVFYMSYGGVKARPVSTVGLNDIAGKVGQGRKYLTSIPVTKAEFN